MFVYLVFDVESLIIWNQQRVCVQWGRKEKGEKGRRREGLVLQLINPFCVLIICFLITISLKTQPNIGALRLLPHRYASSLLKFKQIINFTLGFVLIPYFAMSLPPASRYATQTLHYYKKKTCMFFFFIFPPPLRIRGKTSEVQRGRGVQSCDVMCLLSASSLMTRRDAILFITVPAGVILDLWWCVA